MLSITNFDPKRTLSEVRAHAGAKIWTYWMLVDREMQGPELHRWISKLTARPPPAESPPGDLLITMVKETVILYEKEFRKMGESHISP